MKRLHPQHYHRQLLQIHYNVVENKSIIEGQIRNLLNNFPALQTLISDMNPSSFHSSQWTNWTLSGNTSFLGKKKTSTSDNCKKKGKYFTISKVQNKQMERQHEEKTRNNTIKRGSKYRGVSRNGNLWQVCIMINREKVCVGNYNSEDDAAKAYDEFAMKYHGDMARTNFLYEGYLQVDNS